MAYPKQTTLVKLGLKINYRSTGIIMKGQHLKLQISQKLQ